MINKKLLNYLCLSGVISVIFYFLHDIIGAINYPGYNWMSQAVSDLTAIDAPSFVIANGFVTVYKIFICICCITLCLLIKKEKSNNLRLGIYLFTIMNFISAIGYSLFPLTSSGYDGSIISFIHVYIITGIVIILSVCSMIIISYGSLSDKTLHKSLGIMSIIFLVLMFVGSVISGFVPNEVFGIFERISTYSVVIYTAILGIFGFKKLN